jgi:hypothetical protein
MSTQDIVLLLANYMEQGSDRETRSMLDHELCDRPHAGLFLINHRHALSFYKQHQDNVKLGWMVEYFEKRMPVALKELAQELPAAGELSFVR